MSIRITRWSPDTCSCVIDVKRDDADSNFSDLVYVKACPRHQSASASDVMSENKKKNINYNKVVRLVPDDLKRMVTWSVDREGKIKISSPVLVMANLDQDVDLIIS